ncbi:hypothetical protein PanWU01x14_014310 [Parasponia andersonii]|uniref:Uncharacterized protein n=1 Tax=Parasponia andersonii TaxID=3476 RepID=A0A2P5E080_PARAD|nr:hypothetical protein PanWU01x14_014310 [Parasponia andersonii]
MFDAINAISSKLPSSLSIVSFLQMADIDNDVHKIDNNDEAYVWIQRHEEIFIGLMEEEVIKGNRSTTTFSKPS